MDRLDRRFQTSISWGHFTAAGPAMASTIQSGLHASGYAGYVVSHRHTRTGDYFNTYWGSAQTGPQVAHTSVHSPGGHASSSGALHSIADGFMTHPASGAPYFTPFPSGSPTPISRITPSPAYVGYTPPAPPAWCAAGVSAYASTSPSMPSHGHTFDFSYHDVRGRPTFGTTTLGAAVVSSSCTVFGGFSRAGFWGGGKLNGKNIALINITFEIYDLKTNEIVTIFQIQEFLNQDDVKKYQSLDKNKILNLEVLENQNNEVKRKKLSEISLTEKECESIIDYLHEKISIVFISSSVLLEYSPKYLIVNEIKETNETKKLENKDSKEIDYLHKYEKYKGKYNQLKKELEKNIT